MREADCFDCRTARGAGDENSNRDVGVFIDHVDGLLRARFGATVLLVHHSGHAHKNRARGATALKGGIDFEYRIEKLGNGLSARMSCSKMKNAPEPSDTWFEGKEILAFSSETGKTTSLVFDPCGPPVAEDKPLKGKQAALYDLITQEAPVSRETLRTIALSEKLFETTDQFKRTFQELCKKEKVVENNGIVTSVDLFLEA